jgi:hypothetical protein
LALAANGHEAVGRHAGCNALAGSGRVSAQRPEARALSVGLALRVSRVE